MSGQDSMSLPTRFSTNDLSRRGTPSSARLRFSSTSLGARMPDRRFAQGSKSSWGEQLLPHGSFYRGSSSGFVTESSRRASIESSFTGDCSFISDGQQEFDELSILSVPSLEPVSAAFSQESIAESFCPDSPRSVLSEEPPVGAIPITPAQLSAFIARERDQMEAQLRPKIEAELSPVIEAKLRAEFEARFASQRPAGIRGWFESNRIVRVLSGDFVSLMLYVVSTITSIYINWANATGRSHSYMTQVALSVLTGFASCAALAIVTAGNKEELLSPDSVTELTFGEVVQYAGANGTSLPYKSSPESIRMFPTRSTKKSGES